MKILVFSSKEGPVRFDIKRKKNNLKLFLAFDDDDDDDDENGIEIPLRHFLISIHSERPKLCEANQIRR